MRKCICGKKMYALALYLLLMVLMLSSLTGCGKKDGSRYFEIDQEIWRMDEQGEVSQIYGKYDRGYEAGATGLYDDGDRIYFYIQRTNKTELTSYDKKSGEMSILHTFEAGEGRPLCGSGFVGYGDYLYCLSGLQDCPISRISKSDGTIEDLGIEHHYPFNSSMFTISDGKLYYYERTESQEGGYTDKISQYDLKSGEIQSFDIGETIAEIGRSLSDPFAGCPPVRVYFNDSSVFLIEHNYYIQNVYRAKLGGELKFEPYSEIPQCTEDQTYISDDAIVSYFWDETERKSYYTLVDKSGKSYKLSQGGSGLEGAFPSIMYYPDFCVSPCSYDSDSYCLSDYAGNMVIFELPE